MRFLNKMAQLTVGYSQPDALIDYLKYGHVNPPSNFKFKYGCVYFLKVFKPTIIGELNTNKLTNLSSYREHFQIKLTGYETKTPEKLGDTLGRLLLVNQDYASLERDIAYLSNLEKNNELFLDVL